MKYTVKKGVVLFRMLGRDDLFPSRESGIRLAVLLTPSDELVRLLRTDVDPAEISEETRSKLQRLVKLGFVEECP